MPFDTEDEEIETDEETTDEQGESRRRRKPSKAEREATRRAEAAEAELAKERRARVLLEVGLPDTPQAKFFAEKYDGEPTKEAAQQAARELGFLPPDTSKEELEAHEQIAGASAGAASPSPKLRVGSEEYNQRIQAAKDPEEVMRIMAEAGSPITSQ